MKPIDVAKSAWAVAILMIIINALKRAEDRIKMLEK